MQHYLEQLGLTVIRAPLRGDYPYCKRGRVVLINEALTPKEAEAALSDVWQRLLGGEDAGMRRGERPNPPDGAVADRPPVVG